MPEDSQSSPEAGRRGAGWPTHQGRRPPDGLANRRAASCSCARTMPCSPSPADGTAVARQTLRSATDRTACATGSHRRGGGTTRRATEPLRLCVSVPIAGERRGRLASRGVPTPDDMMNAVTDSMAERTGRSLEEWVALVAGSGVDPLDQNAVRRWLREVHGVKQNSQWAIADAAARDGGLGAAHGRGVRRRAVHGREGDAAPDLRRGARGGPRRWGTTSSSRGGGRTCRSSGVGSSPRWRRPRRAGSTSACGCPTRRRPPAWQPANAPGSATHRVQLSSVADVDDEVRDLLRAAYEQNG